MKNKGLLVILIGLTLMIVVTAIFTISNVTKSKKEFIADGYILSPNDEVTVTDSVNEQHYFAAGETYQEKYQEQVIFTDTQGNKVVTDNDVFLHYLDNSIGSFTKGVILDLNDLVTEQIGYYGVTKNTVLVYNGNSYTMNNAGQEIEMTDFAWKISDTDYLLVSNEISLHLSDSQEITFLGYVQIKYVDEGIVRVIHQEGTYQTVSGEAYLEMSNGVSLKLNAKSFYLGGEEKVSLDSMIISADDNINVEPSIDSLIPELPTFHVVNGKDGSTGEEGEEGAEGEEGQQGEEGTVGQDGLEGEQGDKGNTGKEGNTGADGEDGTYGKSGYDGKEGDKGEDAENTSDPNAVAIEQKYLPEVAVKTFETTAVGINAALSIEDVDDLLEEDLTYTIYERSTMVEKMTGTISKGMSEAEINTSSLLSDTEYVLIVKGKYSSDGTGNADTIMEKDFFTKVFKTDELGVTLVKSTATDSSLTFKLDVSGDTTVTTVSIILMDETKDPANLVATYTDVTSGTAINIAELKLNNNKEFTFVNLDPDTTYYASLANITTSESVSASIVQEPILCKTLKTKPDIESIKTTITPSQKFGTISLSLPTAVTDTYNGITGYRYELYNNSDITSEGLLSSGAQPVVTAQSDNLNSKSFNVDGTLLLRDVMYRGRIVAVFYDNEKEVEYTSQFSDAVSLEDADFPVATFTMNSVTWEKIEGTLQIEDTSDMMKVGSDDKIKIYLTSDVQSQEVYSVPLDSGDNNYTYDSATSTYTIPFSFNNLKEDTVYTLSVFGTVNTSGKADDAVDINLYRNTFIGGYTQQTGLPTTLTALLYDASLSSDSAFSVTFGFAGAAYEASTASLMTFSLYSGSEDEGNLLGTVNVTDTQAEAYTSSIKNDSYNGEDTSAVTPATMTNFITLEPEDFGLQNNDSQLTAGGNYIIKLTKAVDYTTHKNELPFADTSISVNIKEKHIKVDGAQVNNQVTVLPIKNSEAGLYGKTPLPDLADDTVIGFHVLAKYPHSDIHYITYYAYNVNGVSLSDDTILYPDTQVGTLIKTKKLELAQAVGGIQSSSAWDIFFDSETISDLDSTLAFQRGNKYYFRYEVEAYYPGIDCNEDALADQYPNCTYSTGESVPFYRSPVQTVERQTPSLERYQAGSGSNTVTWYYRITDPDHALTDKTFYVKATPAVSETISDSNIGDDAFHSYTFHLNSGTSNYSICTDYQLVTGDAEKILESDVSLYETLVSTAPAGIQIKGADSGVTGGGDGIVNESGYRLRITLRGADINKYAALKLIFTNKADVSDTLTVDDVMFTKVGEYEGEPYGFAYVDLSLLQEFLGKTVTVDAYGYYDTKETGFGTEFSTGAGTDTYALRQIDGTGYLYKTLFIPTGSSGTKSLTNTDETGTYLSKSLFQIPIFAEDKDTYSVSGVTLPTTSGSYEGVMRVQMYGENFDQFFNYDKNGMKNIVDNKYYTVSKLALGSRITSNVTEFAVDTILPAVSNGTNSAGVSGAVLPFTTSGFVGSNAEVYPELFIKGSNGAANIPVKITREQETVNGNTIYYYQVAADQTTGEPYTDQGLAITNNALEYKIYGLTPNTNYVVKLYMNSNGNNYYLWDMDREICGYEYTFTTKSSVAITVTGPEYSYISYINKHIYFHFAPTGDDGTNMTMLYIVKDALGNTLQQGTLAKNNPNGIRPYYANDPAANEAIAIDFSPTATIRPQTAYSLTVYATSDVDDQQIGSKTVSFTTETFTNPSATIFGNPEKTSITFNLVITDFYKVMMDGKYQVEFYKKVGTEQTKQTTAYDGNSYDLTSNSFTIGSLDESTEYIMNVLSNVDTNNDGVSDKVWTYAVSTMTSENVDPGSVVYTQSGQSVTVAFSDTHRFDQVSSAVYTIFSSNATALATRTANASNFTQTSEDDYGLALDYAFTSTGKYYLGMQFYNSSGELVAQVDNVPIIVK